MPISALQIKILNPKVGNRIPLPTYATPGSAAFDLRACLEEPVILEPDQTVLIQTGIAIYIADPTLAGLILPRSGLAHKQKIILGNSAGLIDSDYQGELLISCWNCSKVSFTVQSGDRIAQMMIIPVQQITFEIVDHFEASIRADGGFGHSGHD